MKSHQIIAWVFIDLLFLAQLIGLYFECLNKGFSYWYLVLGIVLIICVNTSIILDKFVKPKNNYSKDGNTAQEKKK